MALTALGLFQEHAPGEQVPWGHGLGALPGAALGAGTQRAEICLFGQSALLSLPPPSLFFFFFFLEVASELFKCSKKKTEGENKLLWNVAES